MTPQQDIRLSLGHVFIEAGPGTGKTTTLVDKIAYDLGLLEDQPVTPIAVNELVAVTFTRASAAELRERLRALVISRASSVTGPERSRLARAAFDLTYARIGTIDAFCQSLVRDHGARLGFDGALDVLDEASSMLTVRSFAQRTMSSTLANHEGLMVLVRSFGYTGALRACEEALTNPARIRRAQHRRTCAKNGLLDWHTSLKRPLEAADAALERSSASVVDFFVSLNNAFEDEIKYTGRLTHGHVMLAALDLATRADVQAAWRSTTRLLCVDEHQDTSRTQAHILFALLGLPGPPQGVRGVFVGDPKQSIYAFRNADIRMWSTTLRHIESSGGLYTQLVNNHRSASNIVYWINDAFSRIMPKERSSPYDVLHRDLSPVRQGGTVDLVLAPESSLEAVASSVARYVRRLLDAPPVIDTPTGPRPLIAGDIAILSRRLSHSGEVYRTALAREGIPCVVQGGRGLYVKQEVRELVHALLAIIRPTDPVALTAYLRSRLCNISDTTLALAVAQYGSLVDVPRKAEDPRLAPLTRALILLDSWHLLVDRLPIALIAKMVSEHAELTSRLDTNALIDVERLISLLENDSSKSSSALAQELSYRLDSATDGGAEVDSHAVLVTTIHGAKGLEWPVVIVTGLDEKIITRDDACAPQFWDKTGVILPAEIAINDTVSATPAWSDYTTDAQASQYAEAARVLYVAATRARDILVLAGALTDLKWGKIQTPPTLASTPQWRHMDRYERWLRHLYPELARGATEIIRPRTTIHVYRAVDLPTSLNLAPLPSLRLPYTPSLPPKLALVRQSVTASELLQFETCHWRHHYGFAESMTTSRLVLTGPQDHIEQLQPSERGAIVHDYLRRHDEFLTPEEAAQAMRLTLLRHVPMPLDSASAQVPRLLQHAKNYLASPLASLVRSADEVVREVPFWHRLNDNTILEGTIDLAYRLGTRWHIVDFKAAQFGSDPARIGPILDAALHEYEIQALLYSLALSGTGKSVEDFTFFFTDVGQLRTIPLSDIVLGQGQEKILNSIAAIRRRDWGAKPEYLEKLCRSCPFLLACRPVNMPQEQKGPSKQALPPLVV